MTFTIVVPVHNSQKYINDMIEPMISQMDKGIDFEVLLVENGSSDSSPKICDELSEKYPEVRSLHYGPIGAYSARREGIKNAKGQWLIFVDADDVVSDTAISEIKRAIDEASKDCPELDMVLYNAAYLDDKSKKKFGFPFEEGTIYSGDNKKEFYEIMCKNDSLNALWNKCIKRDLALASISEGEEDKLNHGEDLLQTAAFIDGARAIVYVDKILYYYRRNAEGLTGGYHPEYITDQERAWNAFSKYTNKWVGESFDSYINARKALTCTIAVKNVIHSMAPVSEVKATMKKIMSQEFYDRYADLELPSWAPEEDVFYHRLQTSDNAYMKLVYSAMKYSLKTKIKRILRNGL